MKMLVNILIAGALSTTGAFAGEAGTSRDIAGNDNTIATPQLPSRPVQKRPTGARQASVTTPRVNLGTPRLPFRPYQKIPMAAPSSKPRGIETAKRQ
jgi:hypothetical protein